MQQYTQCKAKRRRLNKCNVDGGASAGVDTAACAGGDSNVGSGDDDNNNNVCKCFWNAAGERESHKC